MVRFMKTFCKTLTAILIMGGCFSVSAADSSFDVKTKIRLEKKGVWLESEISPQTLLAAFPFVDRNGDHRLDEDELCASRDSILSYYALQMKLTANDKPLAADSTYFAFRSPAASAATPDRFYIYHWYATLRRPERLQISNNLFCMKPGDSRHQGVLISEEQVLKFDFPQIDTPARDGNYRPVLFEISTNGEAVLIDPEDHIARASIFWAGLGLGGLVLLRMAAYARRRWSQRGKREDFDDGEENVVEQSAVLSA